MSENFLQRYQRHLGLTPDGVIGPKTRAAMMADLGWTDPVSFVLMMGQAQHESGNFKAFRESLNYTSSNLMDTFNTSVTKRFSYSDANKYGRTAEHAANQEMIANIAYANRGGNGDRTTGDGWKYRGGGCLQITFKDNWLAFFNYLGRPLDTDPQALADDIRAYFMSVKFYFDSNHLQQYCKAVDEKCVTYMGQAVNRGPAAIGHKALPIHYNERLAATLAIAKSSGVGHG